MNRLITGSIYSKAIRVCLTKNAWKIHTKEKGNSVDSFDIIPSHPLSLRDYIVNGKLIPNRASCKKHEQVLSPKVIITFPIFTNSPCSTLKNCDRN